MTIVVCSNDSSSVVLPHGRRPGLRVWIWRSAIRGLGRINSCGALRHWSSNPRFKFCQEPSRGISKCFEVLFCMFAHEANHSSEGLQGVVRP